RLEEPDVRNRRGQVDVAHALATHLGQGDLGAALLADHAAVLHALVFAAQALVVLDRTEDGRAEQAIALWLERAVVDGLRLLDFAEGPRTDQVRRRERDLDRVEVERGTLLVEQVEQVFHFLSPQRSKSSKGCRSPRDRGARVTRRSPARLRSLPAPC